MEPADRVDITGFVANVQPYLEETAVFVVPLLSGAGMRVKILDAWCSALPIVSTTIGAEGIEAKDGEDILLADSPDAFAESTLQVLQSRGLARRLGEAGRATVERSYDWRKVYRAWDSIYH
jgi:glycosyltransferase involved in cell wall biosynthesis